MLTRHIIGVLIGAILGGIAGFFGKCSSGVCPLTSHPITGALFGGLLGFLAVSGMAGPTEVAQPQGSDKVQLITTVTELSEVLEKNQVVLVDFYADWCGPCRMLKPVIHELAAEYAGRVKTVAVNVDEAREIANVQKIRGIPDVRLYKDGKQVRAFVGVMPKSEYISAIDQALAGIHALK